MNKIKIICARWAKSFTLIELLFSMLILGVAASGILFTFIASMLMNEANRNTCIAAKHAQFILEEIKDADAGTVLSSINDEAAWDWNVATISGEGLTALRNESIDTQASGSDLLTVTVTVTWQDRTGRNRSIVLETYLLIS